VGEKTLISPEIERSGDQGQHIQELCCEKGSILIEGSAVVYYNNPNECNP